MTNQPTERMMMLTKLYKKDMSQAAWQKLSSASYEQLERLCRNAFNSCQLPNKQQNTLHNISANI